MKSPSFSKLVRTFFVIMCLIVNTSPYANALFNIFPEKIGRARLAIHDKTQSGEIVVQLWYPINGDDKAEPNIGPFKHAAEAWNAPVATIAKLPLIVISHGWGGNPELLAWFADGLAKNGFFVAIPQHISDITIPPSFNSWHRPLDISLVINQLTQSSYKDVIDFNRIGFAGYSLGGATGIWLAGGIAEYFERTIDLGEKYANPKVFIKKTAEEIANTDFAKAKESYIDSRIRAEFLMSPSFGWAFDSVSLSLISIPIYIVEVSNDTVIVPDTNAVFFASNIPEAILEMIPGNADHYIFNSEIKPDKTKLFDSENAPAFNYKDLPDVNRTEIHASVLKQAIKFFKKNLND